MNKTINNIISIFFTIGYSSILANPTIYPTGTTIYDPEKAWNGYVLYASPIGKTHLIDMTGNEVHRWELAGFPSELIDPSINGCLLYTSPSPRDKRQSRMPSSA